MTEAATNPSIMQKAVSALARIPYLARDAKTAAGHAGVVEALQNEIAIEQERIAALEARRPTIILEGGDLGQFTSEMALAGQQLRTLQATLSTMQARQQEAERKEAAMAVEKTATAIAKREVPALERALTAYHEALVAVTKAAKEVGEHEAAITGMNYDVAPTRPDLAANLQSIRGIVRDRLRPPAALPKFEESPKPVRVRGNKMPGESQANFEARDLKDWEQVLRVWQRQNDLRRQNAVAFADQATTKQDDVFKVDGEAAIRAIEAVSFPMDAFERERNRRRIDVQSIRPAFEGAPTKRVTAIDGAGKGKFGRSEFGHRSSRAD